MEECEDLCTRLAVIVDGKIKCTDSVQNLKNRFSSGFVITIKLVKETKEIFDYVLSNVMRDFSDAQLKDTNFDMLTFHIPSDRLWSELFEKMILMRNDETIADFSITQMSLEQVFLYFSNFDTDQPV